jgi:hypothetical protein
MIIDNTLLWENMKHLQQVQNGIESLQSKYKVLEKKRNLQFFFHEPMLSPKAFSYA